MRAAAATVVACLLLAGCGDGEEVPAEYRVLGADADKGKTIVREIGCGACHVIPGVAGARGTVGPALDEFGRRSFIAGKIANRPGALARWVRDAPSFDPETAMPAMPLSEQEARDVAAYLYTLR